MWAEEGEPVWNACVNFALVTVLDLCTVYLSVDLHTNLQLRISIMKTVWKL